MTRFLTIAAVLAGLAACAPVLDTEAPATIPTATCGADAYQNLVGQPASAIGSLQFTGPIRVIGPGMAVTMDFVGGRINFETDENERIRRVYCG